MGNAANKAKWGAISGAVGGLTGLAGTQMRGMSGGQGLDQFGNVAGQEKYTSHWNQPWMNNDPNQQGMEGVSITY